MLEQVSHGAVADGDGADDALWKLSKRCEQWRCKASRQLIGDRGAGQPEGSLHGYWPDEAQGSADNRRRKQAPGQTGAR